MRLTKRRIYGNLVVYERDREGETSVPLYVVVHDRRSAVLEEFRRFSSACKWAQKNRDTQ